MNTDFIEKSLLGTMLEENYLILDSGLTADMFLGRHHQLLFQVMHEFASQHHPVDAITLSTNDVIREQIGMNHVMELLRMANQVKFDDYLQVFLKTWAEHKKNTILYQAQQGNWTLDQIMQHLYDIETHGTNQSTDVNSVLDMLEQTPFVQPTKASHIVPYLHSLAKVIDGFRVGELTVIAGRPSMGKTDVMNNLALQAGWQGALPIIFSLEMSRELLVERLIAAAGKISRLKMRNPYEYFSAQQKQQWQEVLKRVKASHIHIDDRCGVTVPQIRAQARRIIRKYRDLQPIIFIDYLQIIRPELDQDWNTATVSKISRGLKQMAKELNCPVICLSQLNRNVEVRQVKRPVMSDLRDSGSIEQDADVIMLLYRASYYDEKPKNKDDLLELIVAKNRNGPTQTVFAKYTMQTGIITNVEDMQATTSLGRTAVK